MTRKLSEFFWWPTKLSLSNLNISALIPVPLYLFLDRKPELAFHPVHQMIFAAGIQHPLLDATLVAGHRIDEDWKELKEN